MSDASTTSSRSMDPAQIRQYFAARVSKRFNGKAEVAMHCLWHDDSHASLSLNLNKGVWICHAGCGEGGLLDFEQRFSGCDRDTARRNIEALLGASIFASGTRKPEAVYRYTDARGRLIFEKLRFAGKHFQVRREDEQGRWIYNLNGLEQKPLYRLREVVTAQSVVICEGEKDCDNVMARLSTLDLGEERVAATTNFDGAGKWKPYLSPYLAGRTVVILPDNDEAGRQHAEQVAATVYPFAAGVKIVNLPGLPEKGDVSDFLECHRPAELLEEIRKQQIAWQPSQHARPLFYTAEELQHATAPKMKWIVNGLVAPGAITNIDAKIKTGKTTFLLHLINSVLEGKSFLGLPTSATSVLILTEQPRSSFLAQLERAGLLGKSGLHVLFWTDTLGKFSWPEIVDKARERCAQVGAGLLIIDTLSRLAGMKDEQENSTGNMQDAYTPLSMAAADEIGVLVSRHSRKSGGEVGDSARGNSAGDGVADIILSLRRPEGNHGGNFRKLETLSRFEETPSQLTIELTPNGYVSHGEGDDAVLEQVKAQVESCLPDKESDALTLEQLTEKTKAKRSTVQRVLDNAQVSKIGSGKRGDPYRYCRRQPEQA